MNNNDLHFINGNRVENFRISLKNTVNFIKPLGNTFIVAYSDFIEFYQLKTYQLVCTMKNGVFSENSIFSDTQLLIIGFFTEIIIFDKLSLTPLTSYPYSEFAYQICIHLYLNQVILLNIIGKLYIFNYSDNHLTILKEDMLIFSSNDPLQMAVIDNSNKLICVKSNELLIYKI